MLLYYHGTDAYRLRRAVSDLVAATRQSRGHAVLVTSVDGTREDAAEHIERHLKYPSFFGDVKLIVVTDAAGPALDELLGRYTVASMDDIILVAVQDTTRKGADKKVMAVLARQAKTTTEVLPLKGNGLIDWVREYCSGLGSVIEPDAAAELIRRAGSDTGLLAVELDKLTAYSDGSAISSAAVRLLTPVPGEHDEWGLSNALAAHDKRATLAALWRSIREGTPEQLLIGTLVSGLRNLLIIKDLSSRTAGAAGIAKLTGLHPFVVSKSLRGASAADAHRLRSAHAALARLDRDAKDGRADAIDGMFSAILSL